MSNYRSKDVYRWFPIPDLIGDGRNGKNKIAYEPVLIKELEEVPHSLPEVALGDEAIVQVGGQILVREVEREAKDG